METKIQDRFIDYGCGFPVVLKHVPMAKVRGKWVPSINYNEFEKLVLLMLCHKKSKLTGNEVRFIRLYFEMTLQLFAKRFGVQHPTIIKWENFKDNSTNMALGTEKDLRLFVVSHLFGKEKVDELYNELENIQLGLSEGDDLMELDVDKMAV